MWHTHESLKDNFVGIEYGWYDPVLNKQEPYDEVRIYELILDKVIIYIFMKRIFESFVSFTNISIL